MRIFLHSYTFRDCPLEEAFRAAHEFGYDGLELSRVHFDDNSLERDLPVALELAKKHEVPIGCVDFSSDFINEDETAVRESVALLEKNVGIVGTHGITLMNGYVGVLAVEEEDFGRNGSALATDIHYERAAEALFEVCITAGARGVQLGVEIHMNTIHDTVASTRRLLDLVGSGHVMATPDPGNMYATCRDDRDPAALKPLRDRMALFHLKNCREDTDEIDFSVSLAEGVIDISAYLHMLAEFSYNGPFCIEHVGEGDPKTLARRDIVYLRQCASRIQQA